MELWYPGLVKIMETCGYADILTIIFKIFLLFSVASLQLIVKKKVILSKLSNVLLNCKVLPCRPSLVSYLAERRLSIVGTRSLNSFLTRSSQCVEKQVMISIAIDRIVVASTPASFGTLLSSITMDK